MSTAEITIHVNPELALAYNSASEEDRRKMGLFLSLQLDEFMHSPLSLKDAMKALSDEAIRNGMTPEILESILND